MTTNVLSDKTYYVLISPRMGLWKSRFALEPVRPADLDDATFRTDIDNCKWVIKTEASENWARSNIQSISSKQAEYYPDWLKQPDAEKPNLAPDMAR